MDELLAYLLGKSRGGGAGGGGGGTGGGSAFASSARSDLVFTDDTLKSSASKQ